MASARQVTPGRVLASAYYRPDLEAGPSSFGRLRMAALMVVLGLPMFAQSFQYVVDLLPLYALSKVWPILTLPLAIAGAARLPVPGKALLLVTYAWLFGVSPAISIVELGNTPLGALSTTIKVWPLINVFGLAAFLVWMKPDPTALRRICIGLGLFTFATMLVLWVVVPFSAYQQGILETKLFLWDIERGKRIYAPMFFGMLSIFTLNRSMWIRPKLWKALLIIACFVVLLTLYKQRTAIAAAGLTVLIGAILSLPRRRALTFVLLGAVAVMILPLMLQYVTDQELGASLGGSLSTRQAQLAVAVDFLSAEPWRWLVGVGSMTRATDVSLGDVVGSDYFFLADLGWLGVAFEYGLIGAGLLVLIHLLGLYLGARLADRPEPLGRALLDYVIYILLTSAVYSPVFAPGELAACMGLAYYLHRARG